MSDQSAPAVVPLERRSLSAPGLEVRGLPYRQRLAFRCLPAELPRIQPGWPTKIPTRVGAAASDSGFAALCLSPDEWLLIAPEAAEAAGASIADIAGPGSISLTDISDRSVGVRISGARSTELLASAVAFDIGKLSPSSASRTLFGRVEALVWRPGADQAFEVEVWRSFADYLWDFVETVAAELG